MLCLQDKVIDIIHSLNERQVYDCIEKVWEICKASKTCNDVKLSFASFTIFGVLFFHIEMYNEARMMFEFYRDLASEIENWPHLMVAYEWIGKTLQASRDYQLAIIAFKKMLQMAWITNSTDFEVKAYGHLAKQYFYLQFVAKSNFYSDRALRGKLEDVNSGQRKVAHELFQRSRKLV